MRDVLFLLVMSIGTVYYCALLIDNVEWRNACVYLLSMASDRGM